MTQWDRWAGYARRAHHWAADRVRTLARQGKTDEEIHKETGIPIINVIVLTRSIRDGNKAPEKRQAQDRQIRQGESGSQASPDVGLKEDSSAEEQEAEGR